MKNISTYIIFFLLTITSSKPIQWEFQVKDIPETSSNLRSLIQAPTDSDYDSQTTANICLGTPAQCFNLLVQSNSFFLFVSSNEAKAQESKNKFDYSKSSTVVRSTKEYRLKYYGVKIVGNEAQDILSINGEIVSRIRFLLATNTGSYKKYDGIIGLGYNPSKDEKKFSIIQQLFDNGKIPHKVFSQKYSNGYKGYINIGEIPKYIVEDYLHYGRCKALNKYRDGKEYKNNNWECSLDKIYFGSDVNSGKSYTDEEVLFLSYRKRSFLPEDIFEYITEKLVSKNEKCELKNDDKYSFYECDKDVEIDSLSLIFDNWEMKLNSSMLFVDSKENGKKDFIFYHKKKFEKFLLGRSLLMKFEIVYDYANKQIGFYHPDVKYIGNEKVEPPKVYQFLDDDKEFGEKKVNKKDDQNLIPTVNPEEVNKNKVDVVEQRKSVLLVDIFKVLFEILIAGIIIIVLAFFGLYALRLRRKNIIKQSNRYLKKERMLENKISV